MRTSRMVASVLLPVFFADLSLVFTFVCFAEIFGRVELAALLCLIQCAMLPFFMGWITAYYWCDRAEFTGNLQDNVGCSTLGLWMFPTFFFSCGVTFLLIPLLLIPYWKGVDFGMDFWPRRRWREWLGLDVEQRK